MITKQEKSTSREPGRAVANNLNRPGNNGQRGVSFEDNRPEAKAQESLQRMIDESRQDVIQRAMGMEVELGRGVASSTGNKLEGDAHIIEHADFNLVTDSRGNISNIEFVMHHFDQHEDEEVVALAELGRRLDVMKVLYDLIVGQADQIVLATLAPGYTYAAAAIPSKAAADETTAPDHVLLLAAADCPRAHDLFVQYTIGYALSKIFEATTSVREGSYNMPRQKAKEHARDALAFANDMIADTLNGIDDGHAVKGYMTLVYLQVAAFADSIQEAIMKDEGDDYPTEAAVARSPGQIKNKTILLSRVPLKTAYGQLSQDARDTIDTNNEDIIDAMATKMEGMGMSFAETATRQMGDLDAISLINYTNSALTNNADAPVSQQRVFGGMKETPVDASVPGDRGIPLELRSHNASQIDWPTMVNDARALLSSSREINP
jgi:hypothetical protein